MEARLAPWLISGAGRTTSWDVFGRCRCLCRCEALSELQLIDTMQIGAVLALWGCAMQSGANNFACMLVGRIVAGFAIGYFLHSVVT